MKLVDFGFCCPLNGRDGKGFNSSYVGTPGYMAPEIIAKEHYNGEDIDLFAAAVILFIMVSGSPPFMKWAERKDDFYKLICDNRSHRFWLAHEQFKPKGFFSSEFKDLITVMLQLNPQHRYGIADVIGHPWLQGPIATAAEVQHEMRRRKHLSRSQAQDDDVQRNSNRPRRNLFNQEFDSDLTMDEFDEDSRTATSFISHLDADDI